MWARGADWSCFDEATIAPYPCGESLDFRRRQRLVATAARVLAAMCS